MTRSHLWILASLLLAGTAHAQSDQAQLVRSSDAANLNSHLSRLAANPRDVTALIGAGEAALALDDPRAAAGFFARADAIQPNNGRIKAGLGRVMLKMQNPAEALRLFDQASRLGYPDSSFMSDRALARDLNGDQAGAQRDYQDALRRTPDDPELVRRYAASLGISGQIEASDKVLQPLLYKSDRAAWRYRAFILAMNNKQADAKKIVDQTMPAQLASALAPYMQKMPYLTAGQKAAAVHFGHFPTNVGTRIAAVTPTPPATTAPAPPAATPASPTQVASASRTERRVRGRSRTAPGVPAQDANSQTTSAQPPASVPAAAAPAAAASSPHPATQQPAAVPSPSAVAQASPQAAASTVQPVRQVAPPAQSTVPQSSRQPAPSAVQPVRQAETRPAPAVAPAASQPRPTTQQPAAAPVSPAVPQPSGQPATSAAQPVRQAASPTTAPRAPATGAVQGPPAPGFESVQVARAPANAPQPAQAGAGAAPAQPAPMATPSQQVAAASPAPTPAGTTPQPNPEATRTLADIIHAIDVPDSELKPSAVPVDLAEIAALQNARRAEREAAAEKAKKAAAAKAKAEADAKAKKEAEEKKRLAANPSRNWVQIGTGADKGALAFTLRALGKKYPDVAAQDGWSASWGRTNRLLIGPFASFTRARTVESKLKGAGADVFAWQSGAGEVVERIGGK